MKKTDFIFIGLLIIIVVVALFSTKGTEKIDIEYPVKLQGETGMHQVDYEGYRKLVDSNEPFIFVIERTNCGYCQMYMPILEEVVKEKKIAIYYINTEEVDSEDISKLSEENKYLRTHSDWGTPTTIFMKGETILDALGGYVEKDAFLSFIDGKVVYGE